MNKKNDKHKNKRIKEPKIRKISKTNITSISSNSIASCNNYRPTLTFDNVKADKIIVSFTFN